MNSHYLQEELTVIDEFSDQTTSLSDQFFRPLPLNHNEWQEDLQNKDEMQPPQFFSQMSTTMDYTSSQGHQESVRGEEESACQEHSEYCEDEEEGQLSYLDELNLA